MILGIDLGSSFVKIARIDGENVRGIIRTRTCRVDTGKSHEYEYDVSSMLRFIKDNTDAIGSEEKIDGIIFSTQMHGFILEKNGIATNYISWQDERSLAVGSDGKSTLERLKDKMPEGLIQRGGVNFKSELSVCGAAAFFEKNGENPADYRIYTLGSYIISKLTGRNVTHITNAAPTGMYDIYEKRWNTELISGAGLDGISLPEVTDKIEICGYYKGIPVYPDIGDQQATILGGGLAEGILNINVGTASQTSMICGAEGVKSGDIYEIRPYFDGKFIKVVSKLPGGRSLQVIADFFAETVGTFTGERPDQGKVWDVINKVCTEESTDLEVSLGFYRSLLFNEGSIKNINSENLTVSDIIRASYENMAKSYMAVMAQYDERQIKRVGICGKFGPVLVPILKRLDTEGGREYYPVQVDESVFVGLGKLLR